MSTIAETVENAMALAAALRNEAMKYEQPPVIPGAAIPAPACYKNTFDTRDEALTEAIRRAKFRHVGRDIGVYRLPGHKGVGDRHGVCFLPRAEERAGFELECFVVPGEWVSP